MIVAPGVAHTALPSAILTRTAGTPVSGLTPTSRLISVPLTDATPDGVSNSVKTVLLLKILPLTLPPFMFITLATNLPVSFCSASDNSLEP